MSSDMDPYLSSTASSKCEVEPLSNLYYYYCSKKSDERQKNVELDTFQNCAAVRQGVAGRQKQKHQRYVFHLCFRLAYTRFLELPQEIPPAI